MTLDAARLRQDFPIFKHSDVATELIYLDNAASTQKPQSVLEAMDTFYRREYANIHRGVYPLSQNATARCETSREKIAKWIGAQFANEIIFTRGATEAINLVAQSYGGKFLKPGDEILICRTEHHANIVPWQMIAEKNKLIIKEIPVDENGDVDMQKYQSLLGARTYLVAIAHVSNALGAVHPIDEIVRRAHHAGAKVLVDGAQSIPHMRVDVRKMDCDFFCFSGHKMYGPTGIGVLYAKKDILESMPPYQGGGDMIESVSFEGTTYAGVPARFEAGTPAIVEIIGLAQAIDYLEQIGLDRIHVYESELLAYALSELQKVPGLSVIGKPKDRASLISFIMENIHPHDMGQILADEGVCVRTGHHCAQPTMDFFKVPATTRASFAFYNTFQEVDTLVKALHKAIKVFQ